MRAELVHYLHELKTSDLGPWLSGALGELYATLDAQDAALAGAAGGIYADSLFTEEHGQATVYLPTNAVFHATGRIQVRELAPASLAIITHNGPHDDIDRAYGALADHVTRHASARRQCETWPVRKSVAG